MISASGATRASPAALTRASNGAERGEAGLDGLGIPYVEDRRLRDDAARLDLRHVAAEHVPAGVVERGRAGVADAGRRAEDEHALHGRHVMPAFQQARELGQRGGPDGAVDDAMVKAQREG